VNSMNLKINDRIHVRNIEYFNDFSFQLRFDSVASPFSFAFYFDETNPQQKELACVSHFHEAILEHNGETLITGYILSEAFNKSSTRQLVQFAGYSKPGVLEDCEIPPTLYPLQSDNLCLREIAQKLIAPFKLQMVIDPSVAKKMEIKYPTTEAKVSQSIKSFLTELATQRDIIISHDSQGNLLFTKAKANMKPIAHFESGLMGDVLSLSFGGQGLHSHIWVIKQADTEGGNAGQAMVRNPYVPIVYRPKVIIQNSGDDNSTQDVANNALAAELKNIVLTIKTFKWEIEGKLIKPNNIISVLAPELYIYKKTNFFIESVSYTGDAEKMEATLTCVLPQVYNGEVPKNVFVDVHSNSAQ
jgi:prophage tail gpP-like protein